MKTKNLALGFFLFALQLTARADVPIPISPGPIFIFLPDLVVTSIQEPVYLSSTGQSRIRAVVKNIGVASSRSCYGKLQDGAGVAYAVIPALASGVSATVTFYLPYWVYDPDAYFTVTADSTNLVRELKENNNSRTFFTIG